MQRKDLEHIIRAAAAITDQYEIMIVGSQSILGAVPNAPDALLLSMEADVYPLHRPDLADLIDGAIGEMSPFDDRFGYYAQGVGPETAILPVGWEGRVVKIQSAGTDLKIGYCLEPHDLAASKLAAGREKDWEFVTKMLEHDIVDGNTLQERVATLPLDEQKKERIEAWVASKMSCDNGLSESPRLTADILPKVLADAAQLGLRVDAEKVRQLLSTGKIANGLFVGSVVAVDQERGLVYQSIGRQNEGAVLPLDMLSRSVVVGEMAEIAFRDGRGLVADRQQALGKGKSRE